MTKLPLVSTYTVIPEGNYVFRIYDASYDEEFGKIIVKLVNAKGMTHIERFKIKTRDDLPNDKALYAFSCFAKVALNDQDREEIDPVELINCYLSAYVRHTEVPSNKDKDKTMTFANLIDLIEATEFDLPATNRALTLAAEAVKSKPKAKEEAVKPKASNQSYNADDLDDWLA